MPTRGLPVASLTMNCSSYHRAVTRATATARAVRASFLRFAGRRFALLFSRECGLANLWRACGGRPRPAFAVVRVGGGWLDPDSRAARAGLASHRFAGVRDFH